MADESVSPATPAETSEEAAEDLRTVRSDDTRVSATQSAINANASLSSRYGTTRKVNERVWISLAGALVVVGILATVWFFSIQPSASVNVTQDSSQVVDGGVQLGFTVTKTAGVAARCQLDARDSNQSEVGWTYVDVPASAGTSVHLTKTVWTYSEAVAGSIQSCWPTK